MELKNTSRRVIFSSKHASCLQDWADKQNCVKFSPIPSTRHGTQACVSLSEKSAITPWNTEMTKHRCLWWDVSFYTINFHDRYHHPWYPLEGGSSERTADCWGCRARPARPRPSWMTGPAEPDAVTKKKKTNIQRNLILNLIWNWG